jgi:hypothetical protein
MQCLQEVILDSSMTADAVVPLSIKQHELSIGECTRSVISIDRIRWKQRQQRHHRHGLRAPLKPVMAG